MGSSGKTLQALQIASQSRSIQEKGNHDRHRNCMVLILAYLRSCGFILSATQLQNEGGSSILSRFETADNMDLGFILQDYEDFYKMKFGRKPKFTRTRTIPLDKQEKYIEKRKHSDAIRKRLSHNILPKIHNDKCNISDKNLHRMHTDDKNDCDAVVHQHLSKSKTTSKQKNKKVNSSIYKSQQSDLHANNNTSTMETNCIEDGIFGNSLQLKKTESSSEYIAKDNKESNRIYMDEKVLKPIPDFGGDMEFKALASSLQKDILQSSPNVEWDDIVGLDDAKQSLKEAVIMPMKYPELFTGLLSPWRGILLYGPPGNGKTLLAKAVATQSKTTFFNISASSIVSKFRGDSEKLVRVLFELARHNAPSTIFFDEIDAIMGHRGGSIVSSSLPLGGEGNGEHEGSRRMKTEMLVQMDGILNEIHPIFILAASNLPWDLDAALLRRLEKRILVPLPNEEARKNMLQNHFSSFRLENDIQLDECIKKTKNFSGSDIRTLCKEIAMMPLRRILSQLNDIERARSKGNKFGPVDNSKKESCAKDSLSRDEVGHLMQQNFITDTDVRSGLKTSCRSTDNSLYDRYKSWNNEFGTK